VRTAAGERARPSHAVAVFGRASRHALVVVLCLAAGAGCRQDMHDQAKYKPLRPSPYFADGRTSQPSVPGTVARGDVIAPDVRHSGRVNDAWVAEVPLPVTAELMYRGRERYDIFCSVCHDRVGHGGGMIVQRGFRRPQSFHTERLRETPAGYFFDAITNGFGVMPSYAAQIPVDDRWAIVAYVRALQLSQGATLGDAPIGERLRLQRAAQGTD
jgi:mono/diheme cytochrome c family protein